MADVTSPTPSSRSGLLTTYRVLAGLTLAVEARAKALALIQMLKAHGPSLPFPYSSGIAGSRHAHMA